MKAYIFTGQGSQFSGMGKDLCEQFPAAAAIFEDADRILGYSLSDLMFNGDADTLKRTEIAQPAIFVHSLALVAAYRHTFAPDMAAGHSLGELSALTACGALSFEDGLRLVDIRARAMQQACDLTPSTMAAVLGADDALVEQICNDIAEIVVAANFNMPGQVVISGTMEGVAAASEALKNAGARRIVPLQVAGAFHSPLMLPAQETFAAAVLNTPFKKPFCPIYQNVNAAPSQEPQQIQENLIAQLTAPVRWTQSVQRMAAAGADEFIEAGPKATLAAMVDKIVGSNVARQITA
ncbi:MAG: ACP S-malonyltransferase [Sphingobacteriales bacterium]|nr:ACP S-malonyltransferase [Sphingobacteriales bacterium]